MKNNKCLFPNLKTPHNGECDVCTVKPTEKKPRTITKSEKVNLKFGKIRVQVTNASNVRVSQDGTTMIISLENAGTTACVPSLKQVQGIEA